MKNQVTNREGNDTIARDYAEQLKFTLCDDRYTVRPHDKYVALSLAVRDRLVNRWLATQRSHYDQNVKRVYYLSLEFLIGRSLGNNIINLQLEDELNKGLAELGMTWEDVREEELDAGLGNGGLGRLAACFMDSLATLDLPAFGYGLRYDYGIFRQTFKNGYQVEQPDEWLRFGCPWEIVHADISVRVNFGGRVAEIDGKKKWIETNQILGIPHDMPVVGYGGKTVNTLRLWSAKATDDFNFEEFNSGDYVSAVGNKVGAENLTKVLYPNDCFYLGKELRLKQQYFFVCCALHDIMRRFKKSKLPFKDLPNFAAVQLNDTHPSIAVAELMRMLIDEEGLNWDEAWAITVPTLGYTNHTLMPEALEKWPVPMFEKLLPRHLEIIYEINAKFLQVVNQRYPGDTGKIQRLSLIEEGDTKQIRMANLAIVGSHSVNGVAALHTQLLKERVVPDFAAMFPERFNNKTNGVTQRRFLLKANPALAKLITGKIGDKWITDLSELKKLTKFADDKAFQKQFMEVKQQAKKDFARWAEELYGFKINPNSIFDSQIKRLHEYKRQLLNALHIVVLYNRVRKGEDIVPRTFLFSAKAAPGYFIAKLIIKLINNIATMVNGDAKVSSKLNVFFVPNYRVSSAERIVPASDVSEQISTAGTEASGTGNMKFMMNGALTIGTLDGANVEMLEEVGKENFFLFGLTAEEVKELRERGYRPQEYYETNNEIREAIDLIFSGHFNINEPGIFEPIRETLFEKGDFYLHLADLGSYIDAQKKIEETYKDPARWAKMAIMNVACSGKFSSDRTIAEYAKDIWNVKPCKIDADWLSEDPLEEFKPQKKQS
ncbi:alpha-1,4 glucan phosphorylase [Planctomycetales bacterium]|nr:alpha-1,4 glucan phosphorylase [Planctomycetales bacterium]GHS96702.1 alpha-1,4 glucan phosphorylase [Planctomycetales bacterium]GHV20740.1 alpha-1,4 glucan phosphorylase [Planctomycetales bacterium]